MTIRDSDNAENFWKVGDQLVNYEQTINIE